MKRDYILQYVSDIHLELKNDNDIPTIAPISNNNCYLALCGDIGNPFINTYKLFLDFHSKLYTHILLISGNHEYYSSESNQKTMSETDNEIYKIANSYNNVTYLNKGEIIIGRTKFIGCTLWSDISKISSIVEELMNDYNNIYIDGPDTSSRLITKIRHRQVVKKRLEAYKDQLKSNNVIEMHKNMREWLISEINKFDSNDHYRKYDSIIILTHHAPSFKMLDKDDIYSPCYGNNCEDMMRAPVKFWISGHTHTSKQVDINGTICLSNCMGYVTEKETGVSFKKYVSFT